MRHATVLVRSSVRLAVVLALATAAPAGAQVLDRASSIARGGQGASSGRGSSPGGSSARASAPPHAASATDDPVRARRGSVCAGSAWRCLRKAWRDAGLGEVGGLVFPWATVLAAYPYAHGHGGYARAGLDRESEDVDARVAFRLEAEAGYAVEGAARLGAAARVQLPFFLDLATRYSLYWEPEDRVALAIGRTLLDLRLIDAIGIQLRVGVGVLHLHDALGGLFGPTAQASIDLFLVAPLVLSADASIGGAGAALVVRASARAGLLVDGTEIYVGYHHESLAGDGGYVELRSPTVGVRQWL